MNEKPKKNSLAIIGGGIVGLSAAIAWAKNRDTARYPVVLLEKQPIVGGMVSSFKRKGYTFDTSQLIPDPLDLFKYLEIDCALKKFNGYFARIFLVKNGKSAEIRIPSGYDAFKTMLTDRNPNLSQTFQNILSLKILQHLRHLSVTVVRPPDLITICHLILLISV